MDSNREYVLQWPDHAAYVTERFSGLLARQTLVDVTLICEEQKLRVHKLVLASSSLYFEEILTEDIGPEPILLLKDLEFSILKAMIEFMYCGETTVSHIHLPSLLTAARLFKVKELESLVEKMIGSTSPDHNDNETECSSKGITNAGRINGFINNDDKGISVSFTGKNNGQMEYEDIIDTSDSESDYVYVDESNSTKLSDTEYCLYEDLPCNIMTKSQEKINGEILEHIEQSVESVLDSSSTLYSEQSTKNYEKCCDIVQNGCATNDEDEDDDDEFNQVGQCARTYGHKKQKVNGVNNLKIPMFIPQQVPNCTNIDLADEYSDDETIKTNLNSESYGYDLRYTTDSILSIVGCTLADYAASRTFDLLNERTRPNVDNNKDNEQVDGVIRPPPVLRRSVRLNQQESEEFSPPRLRSKLKDDQKRKPKIKLLSRTKRKNKELERRVPSDKVILQSRKNQRKTSKLAGQKCSTKNHLTKNYKEILKHNKLTNSVSNTSSSEKSEIIENHTNEPFKPNTIPSSMNRALWGDMTDVNEDGEVDSEFMEYSKSAEIPFAVGLLPLRAALEKMQATPDHQPRKTRSSALLSKQDLINLKRKNSPIPSTSNSKKQCTNESEVDENNPSAVCHVHIRTSPPDSRPRKRSLSDGATTSLGETTGHS